MRLVPSQLDGGGHPYVFYPEHKIWGRSVHGEFSYSDGEHSETRLLEMLRTTADVSAHSAELAQRIDDWPTEYHLTALRHNLLKPFEIGPGDDVLELGCGCGAITRYLGESGANVVAVEGSPRRAMITAERCRDLPNVAVLCDNIASLKLDRKFKMVTLIGVLEYSNLFIEGEDPVRQCLALAKQWLSDDGVLVIAIENQLGLKYFNASREDHVGQIAFGLNDLYDSQTPVTFGRRELASLLESAGFHQYKFYYPFPDYKLPSVMLSEEGSDCPEFESADLLFRARARDYAGLSTNIFSESQAWHVLQRNGLIKDMANSFLVLAGAPEALETRAGEWLAKVYSSSRKPAFQVETVFRREDGAISVIKRSSAPGGVDESPLLRHRLSQASYVSGELYINGFERLMLKGAALEDLAGWVRPWLDALQAYALPSDPAMLSGEAIDFTPFNLIRTRDGSLVSIDLEWQSLEPIPRAWVLIRSLVHSIDMCSLHHRYGDMTAPELISAILSAAGIVLSEEDWAEACRRETTFQRYVTRHEHYEFLALPDLPLGENRPLCGGVEQMLSRQHWRALQRELADTRQHAQNLERARDEQMAIAGEYQQELAVVGSIAEERLQMLNGIYAAKAWRVAVCMQRGVRPVKRFGQLSRKFISLIAQGGPVLVVKRLIERRQRGLSSKASSDKP